MHRNAILLLLAMGASAAVHAANPAPECKALIATMEKAMTMDHTTSTEMNGTTTNGVTVGGVVYVQVRGKWVQSRVTPNEMVARSQENLRDAKIYTCQPAGDAVVAGVPVRNIKAHTESDDSDLDTLVSLAKSNGLPVRVENTTVSDGDKRHYVTTYAYTGVRAPELK